MSKWREFEESMAEFLSADNVKTTKGSGSVKHEEDLIGETTVSQCKNTDKESYSLTNKDIDRLLSAATILEKFPLFLTGTKDHTTLSIPLTEDTSDDVVKMLKLVIIKKRLEKIIGVNTTDPRVPAQLTYVYKKTVRLFSEITNEINSLIDRCEKKLDVLSDNVQMYDLFESSGGQSANRSTS